MNSNTLSALSTPDVLTVNLTENKTRINLPLVLRTLGATAVIVSAVVYMLQGLHGVDESLRHWVYLAIMAGISCAGIGCQYLLKDSRSARLFFALSALLVPVQVTQLSALLTQFVGQTPGIPIVEFFASSGTSVLIGTFSAYLCLSVFARPYAKKLAPLYLLLNCLLLLPYRELVPIIVIGGCMMAAVVFAYRNILTQDHRFKLFEGVVVHAMMWLPIAILFARSGFQISDAIGVSACLLVAASVMSVATIYLRRYPLTNWLLVFSAYLLAVLSNSVILVNLSFGSSPRIDIPNDIFWYCFTLPPVVFALIASQLGTRQSFYRFLAAAPLALLSLAILINFANGETTLLLTMLAFIALSVLIKSKVLFIVATTIATLCTGFIVCDSISNIQAISWLAMACAGVVLVIFASLIERFGKSLQRQGRIGIDKFSEWPA